MLQGSESRDLIREYYRLQRRARDLTGTADAEMGTSPSDTGREPGAFPVWHAARHDDVPVAVTDATCTILAESGPGENPDQRSFYVCSLRRIEMAAHLICDGCFADDANPALRLLPEWTEWCIERNGLDGDAAARSRAAAPAVAGEEDDEAVAEDDEAPFRRQE